MSVPRPTMDMMVTHNPLSQTPIALLVASCTEETQRFFRHQAHDEAPCFELMRRALSERNEIAWDSIYRQYTPLVVSWIQEHGQFAACGEDVDYFVNEIFQRFWRACNASNFDKFPGLRYLLAYLKACVHSAITDYLRTREAQWLLQQPPLDLGAEDVGHTDPAVSVEAQVIDEDHRHTFWSMIQQRVQSEQEWTIVRYQFVQGWKPREIFTRYQDLFTDQQEVYRVRDNLVRRLSRDPELRAFFEQDRAH